MDQSLLRRLSAAVDRLEHPFVVAVAAEGRAVARVDYSNRAFRRLSGLSDHEAHGASLASILGRIADDETTSRVLGIISNGENLADQVSLRGPDGIREFEVDVCPVGGEADAGVALQFRDVTESLLRHHASDREHRRLRKLVEEGRQQLEEFHNRLRLSERLASIGTLGAGLGHDMNNLLMPIRGHLDAIEADGLNESQDEHLYLIREALDYLQELTNSLRLFALDPEDPGIGPRVTDLARWWDQVSPLLLRTIPDRISFDSDIPDTLPKVGVAAHRLTQAVLNLLINASEAIADCGRIRISARGRSDDRIVKLVVSDDGLGMSESAQRHAMDPFFTTKTRGQSTGLGMSLVHGIVHGAGGSVEIQSTGGEGTRITLNLPAASEQRDHRPLRDTKAVAVVSVKDRRIAACFTSFLRSAGFEVEEDDQRNLHSAAAWITDASPQALVEAQRQVEINPACRMVAYGRRDEAWEELGATIVDKDGGLSDIRDAIGQIMLAAEEEG